MSFESWKHTWGVSAGVNPPGMSSEEHRQSGSTHWAGSQYGAVFSRAAGSADAAAETINARIMAHLAMTF